MLDYDGFETEQVTVELRYPPAISLWDESGKIWARLLGLFPELKLNATAPNQQIFESIQLRAMIELGAFRLTARGPQPEARAAEVAQEMLEVCAKPLGLSMISRLGFRVIRTHKYPIIEDAIDGAKFLLPNSVTESIPDSAKTKNINLGVRYETETFGISASIRAEEREFQVTLPWDISNRVSAELTKQLSKESIVVIDSDYYTIGAIERDSLNLLEWGRQAERTIKKYWKAVSQ